MRAIILFLYGLEYLAEKRIAWGGYTLFLLADNYKAEFGVNLVFENTTHPATDRLAQPRTFAHWGQTKTSWEIVASPYERQ